MSYLTLQGIRIIQVLVASTVILTLFFTLGHHGRDTVNDGSVAGRVSAKLPSTETLSKPFTSLSKAPEMKAANATLDFQEIIYLSMPYRTDRQDQLSLIAAVTGLKLTMIPGVAADQIHSKAMPGRVGAWGNIWDFEKNEGKAALGIWRAHANVWRYMIDNDVQTALIIEDDIDFDVNIKQIMGALNWQLKYNNTIRWGDNVKQGWNEACPYGCDWDELFVGQCGGRANHNRLDLHHVFPEPHSPVLSSTPNWVQKEVKQIWNLTESAGVRVIAPTWEPICLMGYGVTRMGAMRMLYNIGGWMPFGHPVDNEIAFKTSAGKLSGYTMTPPVFTSWRVGGSQDSDNDAGMNAQKVQSEGPSKGASEGIKNSVRKSLDGFFKKNFWEALEQRRPKPKEQPEQQQNVEIDRN